MTPIFFAASAAVRPLAISNSAARSFGMISSAECFFARGMKMPSFSCVQSTQFSLRSWTRLKDVRYWIRINDHRIF